MIHYIKLPKEISDYIDSLCSSLSGYVTTREWSTPVFNIKRGVFQGDTLSPVLFLILFNPIIQSVSAHPSAGFSLQLQCESQGRVSTPPAKDSFIYAFWSEEGSSEKPGWYLASVVNSSGLGGQVTLSIRRDCPALNYQVGPCKGQWQVVSTSWIINSLSSHSGSKLQQGAYSERYR